MLHHERLCPPFQDTVGTQLLGVFFFLFFFFLYHVLIVKVQELACSASYGVKKTLISKQKQQSKIHHQSSPSVSGTWRITNTRLTKERKKQ